MRIVTNRKKKRAGKLGGMAGRGAAKKRSREHYQRMAALSAEARRAKRAKE